MNKSNQINQMKIYLIHYKMNNLMNKIDCQSKTSFNKMDKFRVLYKKI